MQVVDFVWLMPPSCSPLSSHHSPGEVIVCAAEMCGCKGVRECVHWSTNTSVWVTSANACKRVHKRLCLRLWTCSWTRLFGFADTSMRVFASVRPSTPFSADTDTPTFAVSRYRCASSRRGAAWLADQRLQMPPLQLITAAAPRTGCSASADAFDLSWTVKHINYH